MQSTRRLTKRLSLPDPSDAKVISTDPQMKGRSRASTLYGSGVKEGSFIDRMFGSDRVLEEKSNSSDTNSNGFLESAL